MAIENSVSIDSVLSTFVDSIDVFDCRLYDVSMTYINTIQFPTHSWTDPARKFRQGECPDILVINVFAFHRGPYEPPSRVLEESPYQYF